MKAVTLSLRRRSETLSIRNQVVPIKTTLSNGKYAYSQTVEAARVHVLKRLRVYGLVYEAEILSLLSRGQDGRSSKEEITGEMPDISDCVDFGMYDFVWTLNRTGFKMDTTVLTGCSRIGWVFLTEMKVTCVIGW